MHAGNLVEAIGGLLLARSGNAVVQVRLLRDVLGRAPDDPELVAARSGLLRHPHVAALAESQLTDGSWGRFHTRDTSRRSRFATSEIAIRRGLSLGLERDDPVLARSVAYMTAVLGGRRAWADRVEHAEGWPTVVEAITAGTLAEVDPTHPAIAAPWAYWAEIAERALASGSYDARAETRAHRALRGRACVYLGSRYVLTLLGAQSGGLPAALDRRLATWAWERPEGIGYLGVNPRRPDDRHAAQWLESLAILAAFRSRPAGAMDAVAALCQRRNAVGTWDFGPRMNRSTFFPLSDDWRGSNRALDCSIQVLTVLRLLAA
jgi:hypothetical protein